jgi:DNA topoisomerase-1
VKIGRFGGVAQIGTADGDQKPRFARLHPDQSIETITLEEALDLFQLPRTLGELDGSPVTVGTGRFGPYVQHQKQYVSIPKDADPLTITLEEATALIQKKQEEEAKKLMKTFDEDPELRIINGRFGPYLQYKGNNFRIPKTEQKRAAELTLDECRQLIQNQEEKPAEKGATRTRRTYTKRSKQ